MSTTVLPHLQSIEAELAAQATQLEAQIASVQEKLAGIRAVMPMFSQTSDTSASVGTATASTSESSIAEDDTVEDEPEEETTVVAEAPAPAKATKQKKTAQKKAATPKKAAAKAPASKKAPAKTTTAAKAPAKAPAKKATAKKKDGRAASWQKYTRPGVKNESIPDAVKLILETQPENDFKIADVMTALFKDDMPKSQYLKARNRISNVLSGGVRAGDWYKGERGTYRMTAA
ncbi:MAG: hypothetical protein HLUCCA11_24260 [Phormidesmis priestleyi Ana]|uniref:Uncharacterized protein n=1 Tax=Phormidesmis priestleyi Ana TaxID=1666911 RepID=A0A0P7YLT6_9CYAN|nr:MAG: hypothetical protein HLUCCA11_24260 [Phormidesmis priestleyi Ana]